MRLAILDSSRPLRLRSLPFIAVLALAACGDDSPTGGSPTGGTANPGGSGQGGIANTGGNGTGGDPQAGEAPGGSSQGGRAQGGSSMGGSAEGGNGGTGEGGAPMGGNGGAAEGGQGGGSGTPTIADLCQSACGYLAGCFGGDPSDCIVECSTDLGDCSPTQLDEVDSCNQANMNDCDLVMDFTDCLELVSCIGGV